MRHCRLADSNLSGYVIQLERRKRIADEGERKKERRQVHTTVKGKDFSLGGTCRPHSATLREARLSRYNDGYLSKVVQMSKQSGRRYVLTKRARSKPCSCDYVALYDIIRDTDTYLVSVAAP